MMKIVDNHCHILFPEKIDTSVQQAKQLMKNLDIDRIALLSWPYVHLPEQDLDILENLKALYIKDRLNGLAYAYCGFTHYSDNRKINADFMQWMIKMGFDGWKSAEMHPRIYKEIGKGLNDDSFEETLAYVEEQGIPIVCHLGDPISHWKADEVSQWERDNGRFYDETFPTLEQLYQEMEEVLQKHPKLKIALAHFYFTSDNYEYAVHMLEEYENVYMYLTPGREMFVNFSKNTELWRSYFTRFSKKIIMGSDLYTAGFGINRHKLVRKYLEEEQPFQIEPWDTIFQPMHLPEEVLRDIFVNNAEHFSSAKPKPVNRKEAYAYCEYIATHYMGQLKDIEKENLQTFMNYWRE